MDVPALDERKREIQRHYPRRLAEADRFGVRRASDLLDDMRFAVENLAEPCEKGGAQSSSFRKSRCRLSSGLKCKDRMSTGNCVETSGGK